MLGSSLCPNSDELLVCLTIGTIFFFSLVAITMLFPIDMVTYFSGTPICGVGHQGNCTLSPLLGLMAHWYYCSIPLGNYSASNQDNTSNGSYNSWTLRVMIMIVIL